MSARSDKVKPHPHLQANDLLKHLEAVLATINPAEYSTGDVRTVIDRARAAVAEMHAFRAHAAVAVAEMHAFRAHLEDRLDAPDEYLRTDPLGERLKEANLLLPEGMMPWESRSTRDCDTIIKEALYPPPVAHDTPVDPEPDAPYFIYRSIPQASKPEPAVMHPTQPPQVSAIAQKIADAIIPPHLVERRTSLREVDGAGNLVFWFGDETCLSITQNGTILLCHDVQIQDGVIEADTSDSPALLAPRVQQLMFTSQHDRDILRETINTYEARITKSGLYQGNQTWSGVIYIDGLVQIYRGQLTIKPGTRILGVQHSRNAHTPCVYLEEQAFLHSDATPTARIHWQGVTVRLSERHQIKVLVGNTFSLDESTRRNGGIEMPDPVKVDSASALG
jgi:hypothetical protein